MLALEPMEVCPSLRMIALRTPTLPPATHTNVFVVGSREVVLIEPASPFEDEIARVVSWISSLAQTQALRLRAILLTHHHPDHAGGARALREKLGVPLWAHPATAERLAGVTAIDRLLEHGEKVELDGPMPTTLEAIHTPGHAPGHLCFLEAQSRALIAGDMVAGVGTILVEPVDGDMQLYLRSLQQMDALDASMLLPAHGGPIENPRERLGFYIAHRLARERKVLTALRELSHHGPKSARELVPHAYADAPKQAWPLAERSAEAHLIKLAREGHVVRRGQGWLCEPA